VTATDQMRKQARAALAAALRRWYPEDTQLALARAIGHLGTHDLAGAVLSEDRLEALARENFVPGAVAALRRVGKPARGDKIRREAILGGIGDIEGGLQRLVATGLVLMRPAPGKRGPWTVGDALQRRHHLQRELVAPPAVLDLFESLVPEVEGADTLRLQIGSVRHVVEFPQREFEWSLLHLTSVLGTDIVGINRDGTPNRRSLGVLAKGLQIPGREPPHDLSVPEVREPVRHLVAMSRALGLLEEREDGLAVSVQACEAYFKAIRPDRDQQLIKSYTRADHWNEVGALNAVRDEDGRGGWMAQGGLSRLAGARTQVLGDLANLSITGWVFVDALIKLLCALDRGYLGATLTSALGPGTSPEYFVEALLTMGLPWLGLARVGMVPSSDGPPRQVFQLTKRAMETLGPGAPPATRAPRIPPLIVQPNLEVTVFLDDATLHTLYMLHRIGSRVARQTHSAVFALTAETVQRAYGFGLDADGVMRFLRSNSRTPLPANVEFALRDWQRVHGKITLYATGTLIEHHNPDKLDLDLGNIEHLREGTEPIVRLGGGLAFVPGETDAIGRVFGTKRAVRFDYHAPPAANLVRKAPLTFQATAGGLDLVTEATLIRIGDMEGEGPDACWRIREERLAAGDFSLDEALGFLRARVVDGVPTEDELRLRAAAGDALYADVHAGVAVVLVSSPELADTLVEIAATEGWVEQRLGPKAILVRAGAEERVRETLSSLGLARDT
jgi:hypothetical protein